MPESKVQIKMIINGKTHFPPRKRHISTVALRTNMPDFQGSTVA